MEAVPLPAEKRAYTAPSWGTVPKFDFALDIIKNGVQVGRVPLQGKDHFILGRQPEVTDVLLDHESISRQHAVLQFGEAGELYITDLGSTHGTKVNKLPLKPKVFTLLTVGCVLTFGESSRLYVLDGPPAFVAPEQEESAEHRRLRALSEARQARKVVERSGGGGGEGASWGMADSDPLTDSGEGINEVEDEGDDGTPFGAAARHLRRLNWMDAFEVSKLNERDSLLHERLSARRQRLRNLIHEADKLQHKASSRNPLARRDDVDLSEELTPGQLAQLSKLEDAISKLLPQLEEEEDVLRERLEAKGLVKARTSFTASSVRRESGYLPDASAGEVEDMSDMQAAPGARAKPLKFVLKSSKGEKLHAGMLGGANALSASTSSSTSSSSSVPAQPHPQTASHGLAQPSHRQQTTLGSAAPSNGKESAVDTYESLCIKLATVDDEIAVLEMATGGKGADTTTRTAVGSGVSLLGVSASVGGDELDAFMAATNAKVAVDAKARAAQHVAGLIAERARLQALVDFVRPSHAQSPLIPKPTPTLPSFQSVATCESAATHVGEERRERVPQHAPSEPTPSAALPLAVESVRTDSVSGAVAGVKRQREEGDAPFALLPQPSSSTSSSAHESVSSANRVDSTVTPMSESRVGTSSAAVGSSVGATSGPISKRTRVDTGVGLAAMRAQLPGVAPALSFQAGEAAATSVKGNAGAPGGGSTALEPASKVSTWVPPVNQSGDGRTTLNERFGY